VYLPTGSSNYVALGARYQSSANFYFLDLRTDRVEIRSFIGNSSTVLSYTNYTVTPGAWYTVTLEVNGNTLKGYINGTQLLTATDSNFSTGAIALSTYQATAEFDDVVVTDFVPAMQTLVVTKTGTGSGLVTTIPAGIACGATCAGSFDSGTTVTLTAAAAANSGFAGWGGACSGTGSTCAVSMTAAKSVTATFVERYPLTVTVAKVGSKASGTVTSSPAGISCGSDCSETYNAGTSVKLTAKAGGGSRFSGWSGACSGTATTCTVGMTAVRAVTATFTK
jgi:hypothetical protein